LSTIWTGLSRARWVETGERLFTITRNCSEADIESATVKGKTLAIAARGPIVPSIRRREISY
jgi:hypothetical protein